jgi:B12-binding domain/radical SAM domain protein
MDFDIIFLHPPAIYDFRKRILFPGVIAHTVGDSTSQFIVFPIGLLSMAEYVTRNGYKTAIDNLGERMIESGTFDVESYLKKIDAKIYAIDLHWCTHSQGAKEIARICKSLHPNSFVVLGGLTSTCFHEEIISSYPFIDGVLRGEAEEPLVQLLRALEGQRPLCDVPNLTYRNGRRTVANRLSPTCSTLDELDYTRLDLVTPRRAAVFERASIPICRGCTYNCVSCGGSAYSYSKMFGREKPAFRSPDRILEDLGKLSEQGIKVVFLFQDARMGGRRYWNEVITALKSDKSKIETIAMELFEPPPAKFLESLTGLRERITLTMSPESGADHVRRAHGRAYTNQEILSTAHLCKKLGLRLTVFFMVGLAGENYETMEETYRLWEELYSPVIGTGRTKKGTGVARHGMGSMVLLDPGSLAFDHPEKYGYKLHFKNLGDYIEGMSMPSWHQWVSYETQQLDRAEIGRLMLDAFNESTRIRDKYGAFTSPEETSEQFLRMNLNRMIMDEVDRAMQLADIQDRQDRLEALSGSLASYPQTADADRYGYWLAIRAAMLQSVGLLDPSS